MVFRIWILFLLCTNVFANKVEYLKGLELYEQKAYKEAFPIILNEARFDNYAAQYRLAEMYDHGLGVKQDKDEAIYWYKRSSFEFSYINEESGFNPQENFDKQNRARTQGNMKGNEFIFSRFDTSTPEASSLVKSLTSGAFFGIEPYKDNYFLPLSYYKDNPANVPTRYHVNDPNSPVTQDELYYDNNVEAEFQFSLKKQISYDFFGMNELIYFGYTQTVYWQLYSYSAPFRETNYKPEIFMSVPVSYALDQTIGLKALKYGFLHESNGQDGYQSRSWNRLYISALWQWKNLFLGSRVWYRIPEDDKPSEYYTGSLGPKYADAKGDENPDIDKYLGYGDLKMDYLNGKSQYSLLLRNNLRQDNKGAIELSYSYPVLSSQNFFLYLKAFHGYGNSLIEYDVQVSKIAMGFSFSRSVF